MYYSLLMLKWLDTDVVSSLSLLLSQLVRSFIFWIVFVLNYNITDVARYFYNQTHFLIRKL